MTYDELVTNIRNYTEVNSNVFTSAVINTFITMAENRILRDIDLDYFKKESTASMTSGNKFLTAPSDILTHRYMMVTSGDDQVFLDFRDTSFMKEYWPGITETAGSFNVGTAYTIVTVGNTNFTAIGASSNSVGVTFTATGVGSGTGTAVPSGIPKYYSVWDQNTFYVAPTPNANFTVELGYIYRPAQLSSTNTTTWISNNAPEALLYACLIQAYSYTKGPPEMLQYFNQSYQQAIQGLGIEQQGRRRRDEYRDGMIRLPVKSESPGP
jgi:hypothetical protein